MPTTRTIAFVRALLASALLVCVAATVPDGAAAAKTTSYKSPGYKGAKSIPNVTPTPLPLLPLGTGKYPHVLVDAAGSGHVMFSTDGGTTDPDQVSYCRLLRGQKTCASTANLAPSAPAGGGGVSNPFISNIPSGNHDFMGPVPLSLGNQLFLVDRRFPDGFSTPDGKTSGSNVFLWTSEDGGASFTGPAIIGDNQMGGGAVVYGGNDNPSIGTISRTQTEGTFFQGVQAGKYTTAKAQLGTSDQAYDGSLAVDGTRPIAAFADEVHGPTGTVFVREWNGSGDVNDAANWTSVSFPGSSPRITAGPSGVYVIYRDSLDGGNMDVRSVLSGGATVSQPTAVAIQGSEASISENPAGGIVAAWIDGAGVELRRSVDGVVWSPTELIAAQPSNATLGDLALAATSDGGGFASVIQNATGAEGIGQVSAAVFGSQKATGLPGLGALAGGGLGSAIGDQLATTTCTDATFGEVDAQVQAGCWLHDPSNPAMDVTLGEVNLNGLKLVPDAGVKIAIDPKLHTIDTSGSVSVILSGGGVNITIFHGELHVKLPTAGIGTDLFDFSDLKGLAPDVGGFPIKGDIDVKLIKGGVSVPVSLTLPKVFGDITGSATLTATLANGLQLSTLAFTVGDANFGGAELKDLAVTYDHGTDLWTGKGTLNVPQGGSAFSLSLDIEFQHGEYKSGSFTVGLPYPGVPLDDNDTPPQLYFSGGGASFGLSPLSLTGKASFGLIPLYTEGANALRDYAFSLDGTLGVSFGSPITLTLTATGFLYSVQVAQGTLTYGIPDQVKLEGSDQFNLGPIGETGSISAVIDPEHNLFGGQISGDTTINLSDLGIPSAALSLAGLTDGKVHIPTVALAFNNKGIGAYIPFSLSPIPFTISYHWGDLLPSIIPFVKRLGEFTAGLPGKAARVGAHAADAGNTFSVPAGAPSMAVVVRGTNGAPSVVLTDPTGKTVTPSTTFTAGATAVAVGNPGSNETDIGLDKPAAGTWTVAQAPGSSVALAGVTAAPGLSDPTIKGSVSGKGAKRTLNYSVKAPSGLTVSFAEQGKSTYQVIGTAKNGKHSISFTPVAGGNPARKIIALVTESGGAPSGPDQVVASFKAPPVLKPTKPASLKVRASKHTLSVSFKVPAAATQTVVSIVTTDGRHLQQTLPRKTHKLSVPVIGYKDGIKVKVTGVNVLGKRGQSATASAKNKT